MEVDKTLPLMTSNGLLWDTVLGSATMAGFCRNLVAPMPLLRSPSRCTPGELQQTRPLGETGFLVGQTGARPSM
jgi:hypothetical protein